MVEVFLSHQNTALPLVQSLPISWLTLLPGKCFLSEDLKAICLQFEHTTDSSQVVKKSRPNLLFHLEKITLCLAFDPHSPLGVLLCRLTQGQHTKSRCSYSWLSLNPCKLSSAISNFSITCPPQPRVTIGTFFIGLHHSLTNTL